MNQDAQELKDAIKGIAIVCSGSLFLSVLFNFSIIQAVRGSDPGMFGMMTLSILVPFVIPECWAISLTGYYSVFAKPKIRGFFSILFSSLIITFAMGTFFPKFFYHDPTVVNFWVIGFLFIPILLGGFIGGLLTLLARRAFDVLKQIRLK